MRAAMETARQLKPARPWLRGDRVFLRHPQAADVDEFLALTSASISFHRGLASPPRTKPQFAQYLARARQPNHALFLICRSEDAAIAGAIHLNEIIRRSFQNAFVGYFIGAPFARRGYMTEALNLVVAHAFRHLKLHRLEANVQPGNKASRRLVERAGFRLEGYSPRFLKIGGRWRDHERWAITVEKWKATNRRD
jgi:ribosomal-protein-alanine N-acetyltransferase